MDTIFTVGIEQWFPLKPIVKDEEIRGELLVEIMIDEYSEVGVASSHEYCYCIGFHL